MWRFTQRRWRNSHSINSGHEDPILRDTDTLYIEFKEGPVGETRDLDENTVLDLDPDGRITAITVEHASERTGIPQFSYEQIAA